MFRKREVTLISETYTTDSLMQRIPMESRTTVIAQVDSVSGNEFFEGGKAGITPEFRITLNHFAFNGEKIVEIDGIRYGVYRTYRDTPYTIELYVERKGGV